MCGSLVLLILFVKYIWRCFVAKYFGRKSGLLSSRYQVSGIREQETVNWKLWTENWELKNGNLEQNKGLWIMDMGSGNNDQWSMVNDQGIEEREYKLIFLF